MDTGMVEAGIKPVRLDPNILAEVQVVPNRLGLNAALADDLFFTQVSLDKGLPCYIHIPNEETSVVIEDGLARRIMHQRPTLTIGLINWKSEAEFIGPTRAM